MDVEELEVFDLKRRQDEKKEFILLDVRGSDEYETANMGGLNIPLQELEKRYHELDKGQEVIAHCHHGGRSRRAALFLKAKGFDVKNLAGGIDAWSLYIDPSVPRY
ncbi:MAG: hypothetical protein KA436_12020 [Oligoflexales bacterium]|nr:hypothetical protein [Oligoflexales bacterium]